MVDTVSTIGYLGVAVPMAVHVGYFIAEIVEYGKLIFGKNSGGSVYTTSTGNQLIISAVFIVVSF